MPKTEEGRRFTDTVYAGKDDLRAFYNREDVDKEWGRVQDYRRLFQTELEMRDNDLSCFQLVLTPTILSACYGLEESLFADLSAYYDLNPAAKEAFVLERRKDALRAVARHSLEKEPSASTIERIATGEIENVPSAFFLLGTYGKALKTATGEKDRALLERINAVVQGDASQTEGLYRKSAAEDAVNTLLPSPAEKIGQQLDFFFLFLNQKEVPLLARAILSVYFFLSVRPMEYVNEETAALFIKNFLRANGLSEVGFAMDFESVLFSRSKTFFARLKESEKTLDMTYVLTSILPYLSKDEENIRHALSEARTTTPEPTVGLVEGDVPVVEEKALALPTFVKNEERKVIEERAQKLRERYPLLKKREAHFYAGHCQIGSYYTIEDFQKSELTVYETGRQGMDGLAKKGFYRKEKQGKKFLYTPIPMKDE